MYPAKTVRAHMQHVELYTLYKDARWRMTYRMHTGVWRMAYRIVFHRFNRSFHLQRSATAKAPVALRRFVYQ